MDAAVIDRDRSEGVYCRWETYPPDSAMVPGNILVIERVNGDCTISSFSCARSEASTIYRFLRQRESADRSANQGRKT